MRKVVRLGFAYGDGRSSLGWDVAGVVTNQSRSWNAGNVVGGHEGGGVGEGFEL
jgi:hypothetical protein